jgi:callose synthase
MCVLKMSYEMHGVLSGAISLTTWEKVMPAYGNEPESFLNNVVTPIYNVIKKVLFNVSSFCFFGCFLQ